MILKIGDGWEIDTALDEKTGEPWADLWRQDNCQATFAGSRCVENCLNVFRQEMGMNDDEINEWQRGES